jgi:diamine N-acetyltransferase
VFEKITIRNASPEDAQLLAELSATTFYESFVSFNKEEDMKSYLEQNFTTSRLEHELKEEGTTFLLALHNNSVVGYAKMKKQEQPDLNEENNIEIERIYSRKEYLGKKVGNSLMEACLDLARQGGYKVVWLGVWEHNPRAISFYEKWGFEKFGTHLFLLGNDLQTDLLMKKNLYS